MYIRSHLFRLSSDILSTQTCESDWNCHIVKKNFQFWRKQSHLPQLANGLGDTAIDLLLICSFGISWWLVSTINEVSYRLSGIRERRLRRRRGGRRTSTFIARGWTCPVPTSLEVDIFVQALEQQKRWEFEKVNQTWGRRFIFKVRFQTQFKMASIYTFLMFVP